MASSAQAKAFIAEIGPIITKVAQEKGYKTWASVIAQACIESAWGTSSLGKKYHNYFGMKCGKSWKGKSVNLSTKEEYTVGTLTTIKDNFRVYDNIEAGVRGYFDFINTSRYLNLKTAKNYVEYAQMLKADGYATSSTYVNTLCSTVSKYDLLKYEVDNSTSTVIHLTIKKGSRGESVKVAQELLNKHNILGGQLQIDGIFGPSTFNAVVTFQALRGLKKDGIIGPKTWAELEA